MEMAFYWLKPFVYTTAKFIEAAGVGVIAFGILWSIILAIINYARAKTKDERQNNYINFRRNLGRGILLGLEFLVAADIINTVAVEPTFVTVGVLAIIVLIRTFLSFTLELEMTGKWPWQK